MAANRASSDNKSKAHSIALADRHNSSQEVPAAKGSCKIAEKTGLGRIAGGAKAALSHIRMTHKMFGQLAAGSSGT